MHAFNEKSMRCLISSAETAMYRPGKILKEISVSQYMQKLTLIE